MATIKTPVCGTCDVTVAAAETRTIFSGTGDCFGSVTFFNCSTNSVGIIINGVVGNPITLGAGCRLSIAREAICSIEIDFTDAGNYIISYRGCICCAAQCPCDTECS